MSNEAIRPSTMDGIKRLAKSIKAERGIPHHSALDDAARAAGFGNFKHARDELSELKRPGHRLYLTAYWRDRDLGAEGRETLELWLRSQWSELLDPHQLIDQRALRRFRPQGASHLERRDLVRSQGDARRAICAAARTFQFMQATGLRPSKSHSRAFPAGRSSNAVPGSDHPLVWYDRKTKRYLITDEPYETSIESRLEERAEWAQRHGFRVIKASWLGMWNPGPTRLHLISDAASGVPLEPLAAALDRLPAPIVDEPWAGISAPSSPYFIYP